MDFWFHSGDMPIEYPKEPTASIAHAAGRGGNGDADVMDDYGDRARSRARGECNTLFRPPCNRLLQVEFSKSPSFGFWNYFGQPFNPFAEKIYRAIERVIRCILTHFVGHSGDARKSNLLHILLKINRL
jgi:hypothetical protein